MNLRLAAILKQGHCALRMNGLCMNSYALLGFQNSSTRGIQQSEATRFHIKEFLKSSNIEDYENISSNKSLKVFSARVTSLRVDVVLKAALQIPRNKIETAFYESKIRVNGEKVLKKSVQVDAGDEVDLIRGPSPTNPDFILVSRVEVEDVDHDDEDCYIIKFRRFKSLPIENYDQRK